MSAMEKGGSRHEHLYSSYGPNGRTSKQDSAADRGVTPDWARDTFVRRIAGTCWRAHLALNWSVVYSQMAQKKENVHEKHEGLGTRKNLFSCDVIFRLKGGAYVTDESGTESSECCAGPRRICGRIRMGRRLQRLEEERIRGDSRSECDDIARRRCRHY